VSKPNLHLVPTDYERKQTLANAERFTTPELKEYESKVLDAQERILEIERRLFQELRTAIAAEAKRIRQTTALSPKQTSCHPSRTSPQCAAILARSSMTQETWKSAKDGIRLSKATQPSANASSRTTCS